MATLLCRILTALLALSFVVVVSCSGGDDPMEVETSKWPAPTPLSTDPPPMAQFTAMPIPADNPTTVQGVALGRHLFYDPILSADSTQSCSSCHQYGRDFSEDRRFSIGIDNIEGTRNAPHLVNAGWIGSMFWDGRAASLEDQAVGPVINPIEMHDTWQNVTSKLQAHPDYPDRFGRAFGTDQITRDLAVKAIAQFERTFVSYNSKYDRYLQSGNDTDAAGFTDAEKRGLLLFETERADCFHCHEINAFLTDDDFHNVGLDSPLVDLGKGEVSGDPNDFGKFKTPSLRNVAVTAPYMHDGRFQTLEDVVGHYNSGGFSTPTVDPLLRKRGVGLGLTQAEISDIVQFLKTMTDTIYLTHPDLGPPQP